MMFGDRRGASSFTVTILSRIWRESSINTKGAVLDPVKHRRVELASRSYFQSYPQRTVLSKYDSIDLVMDDRITVIKIEPIVKLPL